MGEVVRIKEYDWKISAKKALRAAFVTYGSIAFWAVVESAKDVDAVGRVFNDIPGSAFLIPVVVAVATAFSNWRKNR